MSKPLTRLRARQTVENIAALAATKCETVQERQLAAKAKEKLNLLEIKQAETRGLKRINDLHDQIPMKVFGLDPEDSYQI